jgi:hypothetical protein
MVCAFWHGHLHTFLHATAVLRRLLAWPRGLRSGAGLLEEKRCTALEVEQPSHLFRPCKRVVRLELHMLSH